MIVLYQETRKCFYFGKIYEVIRMAKKEKKGKKKNKINYFKEVKAEMKKVSFPKGKEVVKYTLATIFMVAFLVIFFIGLQALLSLIKGAI